MFNCIKESFKITNMNLIIATPLILFSLISTLYLIFSSGKSIIGNIFTIALFFLMISAFLSGWFYMVMKAVKEPTVDKNNLISESFFSGVGEYFVPIMGMIIIMAVISSIVIVAATFLGKYYIGNPGISSTELSNALYSIDTMKNFVESLTQEQLIKINLWNALLFIALLINEFVIMLYAPSIFFKKKNPFIAFFISIKDLFSRHFFKNIGIFLFVFIIYTTLSTLTTIFNNNIIAHFILTLANFYFISYLVVLVFNYYYSNYAKIGSNIDQNI